MRIRWDAKRVLLDPCSPHFQPLLLVYNCTHHIFDGTLCRWDAERVLLDPRAPLVAGRRKWCNREPIERFALDVSAQFKGGLFHGKRAANQGCCSGGGGSQLLSSATPAGC